MLMKKFVLSVLVLVLAAAFALPLLNVRISDSENALFTQLRHTQNEKEISSVYKELCSEFSKGNYSQTLSLCEKCLALINREEYPDLYADVSLKKALSLYETGEYSASLKVCGDSDTHNMPEMLLLKAENCFNLGDFEREEASLIEYALITGDKAPLKRAGEIEMSNAEFSKAVKLFNEYDLFCLAPASITDEAIFRRGICYMSLSDHVRALDDFRRCAQSGIETDEAIFNMAVCELKLGSTETAKENFERCISANYRIEEAQELIKLCE